MSPASRTFIWYCCGSEAGKTRSRNTQPAGSRPTQALSACPRQRTATPLEILLDLRTETLASDAAPLRRSMSQSPRKGTGATNCPDGGRWRTKWAISPGKRPLPEAIRQFAGPVARSIQKPARKTTRAFTGTRAHFNPQGQHLARSVREAAHRGLHAWRYAAISTRSLRRERGNTLAQ